jgi:hypothetical protein
MAVATEERREAVAVEATAYAARTRLHQEILPPPLDPSTPVSIRRARMALAILALGLVLAQFISAPIGQRLNSVVKSGTDPYSLWQNYAANPVPDVLVIGASTARTDVDEPALATELSSVAGHPVTVEKMGFAGQTPRFLDALMYRIMKRQQHPKLIVVAVAGPELNEGCKDCLAAVTGGLWDISDLTDPGFMQLALNIAPDPARLVAGWALPSLAYYHSIIALQCIAVGYGRSAAKAVAGKIPVQLQNPTLCEGLAAYKWGRQPAMTSSDFEGSIANYRGFTVDYHVSSQTASSVADLLSRARSGGTNVVFVQTPLNPGLRDLFPDSVKASQEQLGLLASTLNAGVVNLTQAVPDDATLWVDGLHLDRAGADFLGPELARQLVPYLPTT